MRVLLLANSRSGSRRGPRNAARLAAHLARHGFDVDRADVIEPWSDRLAGAAALLVSGGDGSVLHSLDAAVRSGVPIYHVPSGNENLFARQFGHSSDPDAVAAALKGGQSSTIDLGRVTTTDGWTSRFSMMCSFGPDASVVHRLETARPQGGGHLVYFRPILAELQRPHLPRLRVEVDGRPFITDRSGVLLVANGPMYALAINPARDASMTDGLLDAVFLPATGRLDVLRWAWRCRRRADLAAAGAAVARGRSVTIEPLEGPSPAQLEGELVHAPIGPGHPLTVSTDAGVLRVVRLPAIST